MRRYDEVLPGAANRIVAMAENAATVRNEALSDTTKAGINYGARGQLFAFLLALLCFGAAIFFFVTDNTTAGLAFLSAPVLLLIKSFFGSSE